MSFDATCCCPNCKTFWYECADEDETYDCPKCGYKNVEPEELDTFGGNMDEEEETAIMEILKKWDERRKQKSLEEQNEEVS